MRVLITVSKYVTANTTRKAHISPAGDFPLCGQRGGHGYTVSEGDPTCMRCIGILAEMDDTEMQRRMAGGRVVTFRPDISPPAGTPVFVARERVILRTVKGHSGRELVAKAESNTWARVIAALLNRYHRSP